MHPEEETHYELDLNFIKILIARIKSKTIYDYEIKDFFSSYIQTLLDLAISDDNYMKNEDNKILNDFAEKNEKRISLFRQTNLFKIYQSMQRFMNYEVRRGISMLTLENHIRSLRLDQFMDTQT